MEAKALQEDKLKMLIILLAYLVSNLFSKMNVEKNDYSRQEWFPFFYTLLLSLKVLNPYTKLDT